MRRPTLYSVLGSLLLFSVSAQHVFAVEKPPVFTPEAINFFENKIRPVLVERCYTCHGPGNQESDLRLDSRESVLKGGDSGPALVPEQPDYSLLIQAIRPGDEALQMPPEEENRLSAQQVKDFTDWVRMGAPDPREKPDTAAFSGADFDWDKAKKFWSYQRVTDPPLPTVRDESWPRNGVDRFILSKLEEKRLHPVEDANRRSLIRRATFDLIGLPPTPAEIDAFLADDSADSYTKLIDRLLSSPHYGERWGRHWLDVVRYADTAGDGCDFPIPQAYRYRDYVIQAMNADKPYDRFLSEQIAGDLMPSQSLDEKFDQIIATGFIAMARRSGEDPDNEHHITIGDTIDTIGNSFLAMNLQCASCHDHKFDPISTADYYALYGIFESTRYPYAGSNHKKYQRDFVPLLSEERMKIMARPIDDKIAALEAKLKPMADELERIENAVGGITSKKEATNTHQEKWTLKELKDSIDSLLEESTNVGKSRPDYPDAYAVAEGNPHDAAIHISGSPEKLGPEVRRGFPRILGGQKVANAEKKSGRLQLANWLADSDNPLTARVMVNRIWQHHFGKGIVQTPNVFGSRGMPPTHPRLLDYLASRFVENGWSVKTMHRSIMLSRAYQLSSRSDRDNAQIDESNQFVWRHDRLRLEAESIRDSILVISGELDRSMGGPHPFPARKDWEFKEVEPFREVYRSNRRSAYLMQPRFAKNPFLGVFDGADTKISVGVRFRSTTPIQALFLINDPFVHDQARRFAWRLQYLARDDPSRIDRAHRLVFGRPATLDEIGSGLSYLDTMTSLLSDVSQLPDIPPSQRDMLVPTAHEGPVLWRWVTEEPRREWTGKVFDDSAWPIGSAGFGPKREVHQPDYALYTPWDANDIWMRKQFVVSNVLRPEAPLSLRVRHVGNTEIYLNGVLVVKLKSRTRGYMNVSVPKEARCTVGLGRNLLAIHCSKGSTQGLVDVGLLERSSLKPRIDGAWASYVRVLQSSNEFIYVD